MACLPFVRGGQSSTACLSRSAISWVSASISIPTASSGACTPCFGSDLAMSIYDCCRGLSPACCSLNASKETDVIFYVYRLITCRALLEPPDTYGTHARPARTAHICSFPICSSPCDVVSLFPLVVSVRRASSLFVVAVASCSHPRSYQGLCAPRVGIPGLSGSYSKLCPILGLYSFLTVPMLRTVLLSPCSCIHGLSCSCVVIPNV